MFNIFRKKTEKLQGKSTDTSDKAAIIEKPATETKKASLFQRLSSSRQSLGDQLANLFLGSKKIDGDLIEEIETLLITADVGIDVTTSIIDELSSQVKRNEINNPQILYKNLQHHLAQLLIPCQQPLIIDKKPYVILMVGVNGVGKTTTIGKLAQRLKQQGKSVMLAAGDTFRAAAVEQLKTWGERNQIPVIAQKTGADSASVIFDAIESAKARNIDVLIADTAGRLHTQTNLMAELQKIKRVMKKLDESFPHEIMLVIDGGTGQNALKQAELFNEAVDLTGITVTKLDGTAKGGILFALAKQLKIPIRFIGVGENIADLREFNAEEFVTAIIPKLNNSNTDKGDIA